MNRWIQKLKGSVHFVGCKVIWGVPCGVEPNKPYTVTFNAAREMRISDEHSHFTLLSKDGYKWEASMKHPLVGCDRCQSWPDYIPQPKPIILPAVSEKDIEVGSEEWFRVSSKAFV